jgi:putative ABC transport system permease protein
MRSLRLVRLLGLSLRALLAHRTRSALAVVGVAVGVAAVVLVAAMGEGAQRELLAGMASQGAHLLVVRPAQARRTVARREVAGRVATLTPADGEAIAEVGPVAEIAPAIDGKLKVRSEAGATPALVVGTTASFLRVRAFGLARGRFFSDDDDVSAARVVVLGARVSATLFSGGDPLGETVRVGAVPCEVIGVLEPQGVTADGADVDTQVYLPLRTALRRVFNARALGNVYVRVREGASFPAAEAEIRALLRERHRLDARERPDDFDVQDPERALAVKRQVARTVTLFTAGLAAVSLLVGGTGILALMLLTVRERTPEIGLRRAVGARARDVLVQFLAEAVSLSAAGGLAGVAAGALGAAAVAAATGWPVHVPAWAAAAGLGVSALVGLAFGVLPALRAASLPPSVAISCE